MTALPLLLALALAWPWTHSTVRTEHRHIGDWRLIVRTDAFERKTRCQLYEHGVDYRRGALEFHFAPGVDTSAAVYRVDDGPPIETTAELMQIAELGFAIHDDNLRNPSGGVVRAPLARLQGAKTIAIQPRWGRPPVRFRLGQLQAALEAATKAGCGQDSFS